VRAKTLILFLGIFLTLLALPAVSVSAPFDIYVNFAGGLTPSQETVFSQAEAFWEGFITGYQPGISITNLNIDAKGQYIDGPGNVLGSAGPTGIVDQGGFELAQSGIMSFDSDDLPNLESSGRLFDVIAHEMAHVIGFGTLWDNNFVYTYGSGQYTGFLGLEAYKQEFDSSATFVPVELDGGPGTANGHWDEASITDLMGRELRNELMTGWLDTPTFVSKTTVMSFADIGYEVQFVPVPGSIVLFSSGFGFLLGFVRFRRKFKRG
jgi:hypothetical protein